MAKVNIEELAKKTNRLMLLSRFKYPVRADKDLKEVKELRLSKSSVKLLQYIDILKKCNIGKIGQILGIEISQASRIVHDLQKSKLIKKVRSTKDERKVFIGLTAKGKKIVKAITEYEIVRRRDLVIMLVKEFGESKLKVLSEIADALLSDLKRKI